MVGAVQLPSNSRRRLDALGYKVVWRLNGPGNEERVRLISSFSNVFFHLSSPSFALHHQTKLEVVSINLRLRHTFFGNYSPYFNASSLHLNFLHAFLTRHFHRFSTFFCSGTPVNIPEWCFAGIELIGLLIVTAQLLQG